MGFAAVSRSDMENRARREMADDLAKRASRPRRRWLAALAALTVAAVLLTVLAVLDLPGSTRAREANIRVVPGGPVAVVGDGFPLLRERAIVVRTDDPLVGWSSDSVWSRLAGPDKRDEWGGENIGEHDSKIGRLLLAGDPTTSLASLDVLRHEYGHALYEDLCLGYEYGGGVGETLRTQRANLALSVNKRTPLWLARAVVPEEAWPLLDAYRATEGTAYGDPHCDNCFGEYFAETFARYVAARVPAELDGLTVLLSAGEGYADPAADAAMAALSADQVARAGR